MTKQAPRERQNYPVQEGFEKESPESAPINIPSETFQQMVASKEDAWKQEVDHLRKNISGEIRKCDRLHREKESLLEEVGDCKVEKGRLEVDVCHLRQQRRRQTILHLVATIAVGIGCSIVAADMKSDVPMSHSYGGLFIAIGIAIYIAPMLIKEK